MAGIRHSIEVKKGYRTPLGRLAITLRAIVESLVFGYRELSPASLRHWFVDVFHYRLLRVVGLGGGRRRSIRFKDGTRLTYEMNRGDLRAVAETWIHEAYRLPVPLQRDGTILDLGANIGLTSVWLARTYGCRRLIAVEPSPRNAEILRVNLAENGIPASVIEAAVARENGEAFLAEQADSTLGHLADAGTPVRAISVRSLLEMLPAGDRVALMKIDVEGAEAQLLDGDVEWLERIDCIVAEIHPEVTEADLFVRRVERAGFAYRYLDTANPPYGPYGPDFVGLFSRRRPDEQGASVSPQVT